jgi:hypothetical protein
MEPEVAIEVQSEAEGDDDDETESFSDGESSYDDELDFAELAELYSMRVTINTHTCSLDAA